MKAITSVTLITIVFTVFIILTLVAFMPAVRDMTYVRSCNDNLKEEISKIVYEACELDDTDLEQLKKIDFSCIEEIEYINTRNEVYLEYKIKGKSKDYEIKLNCPYGYAGFVEFSFSPSEEKPDLKPEKSEYVFLIQPNKARLVFCKGSEDCLKFNEEDCEKNKDKGCELIE